MIRNKKARRLMRETRARRIEIRRELDRLDRLGQGSTVKADELWDEYFKLPKTHVIVAPARFGSLPERFAARLLAERAR